MADANTNRVFTCHHCAVEFTGRKRKFCTTDCREAAKRPSKLHTCMNCAKQFEGRKRKHCSEECRAEYSSKLKVKRGDKVLTGKTRRPPNPIVDGCRVCLDCERDLPIDQYPAAKQSKTGYRGVCKPCFAEFNRKRKREAPKPKRDYRIERIRTATNNGECGPPTREQHAQFVEKILRQQPSPARLEREAKVAWYKWLRKEAPGDWCNRYWDARGEPWRSRGFSEAERYRLKYRGDLSFQTSERMRRQLTKAIKRDHVAELMRGAIRRNGRSRRVEELLGYSIKQLMSHLEKQFTQGMCWELFASGDIHIDHITPQAAFDLSDRDQWRACWCLSNLRPCWARENLEKSAKQVFLL